MDSNKTTYSRFDLLGFTLPPNFIPDIAYKKQQCIERIKFNDDDEISELELPLESTNLSPIALKYADAEGEHDRG
jgi:hypothetical protein